MTPSLASTLEGGAEGLGREEWSNVPRLHTELTSSELKWGEGQFRGRWRGVLGRVRRQPRKTTDALVRGPFLFRRTISSSMIDLQVTTTSCLCGMPPVEWTQPCSMWERQDGFFACDSLGEGLQDRELLGGPPIGLRSCSNTTPAAHHFLVATGTRCIDLQSSRPVLASCWLTAVLEVQGTLSNGFAISSTGSSKARTHPEA